MYSGFIVAPFEDGDFTVRAWQVCVLLSPGFRKKERDNPSGFPALCCQIVGRYLVVLIFNLSHKRIQSPVQKNLKPHLRTFHPSSA